MLPSMRESSRPINNRITGAAAIPTMKKASVVMLFCRIRTPRETRIAIPATSVKSAILEPIIVPKISPGLLASEELMPTKSSGNDVEIAMRKNAATNSFIRKNCASLVNARTNRLPNNTSRIQDPKNNASVVQNISLNKRIKVYKTLLPQIRMSHPIRLIVSGNTSHTGIGLYAEQLIKYIPAQVLHTASSFPKTPFCDFHTLFTKSPLVFSFPKNCIIHCTDQQLAFPLLYQKRTSVVTVHDLIPLALHDDPFLRRLFYKLIFQGIRAATHILADSAWTKKDIMHYLRIPEKKISVVPLGVDHNQYCPTRQQRDSATFLCVSSEMPRKNIPALLHAFALVKKEVPHACLIKIGAAQWPHARARHQQLAHKLGIADSVRWIDHVENLADQYRKATALVCPSIYEGFGFPVLEAMACGTPVISSNRTSLPEITGNAALLCDPTPQNLARHMLSVLSDKKRAQILSRKGLEQSQKFSWEKCAEQTREVYAYLLSRT